MVLIKLRLKLKESLCTPDSGGFFNKWGFYLEAVLLWRISGGYSQVMMGLVFGIITFLIHINNSSWQPHSCSPVFSQSSLLSHIPTHLQGHKIIPSHPIRGTPLLCYSERHTIPPNKSSLHKHSEQPWKTIKILL